MNSNLDRFCELYATNLEHAVREHPEEYAYPVETVPVVVSRMRAAFLRGSYNKDGRAIKATCKQLGIPYTYTAINTFLKSYSQTLHTHTTGGEDVFDLAYAKACDWHCSLCGASAQEATERECSK